MKKSMLILLVHFVFGQVFSQDYFDYHIKSCNLDSMEIGIKSNETKNYIWYQNGQKISKYTSRITLKPNQSGAIFKLKVTNKKSKNELIETHRFFVTTKLLSIKVKPDVPYVSQGNAKTLELLGKFKTVLWSTGETTNIIPIDKPGLITLEVRDKHNCWGSKELSILDWEKDLRLILKKLGFQSFDSKIVPGSEKKTPNK